MDAFFPKCFFSGLWWVQPKWLCCTVQFLFLTAKRFSAVFLVLCESEAVMISHGHYWIIVYDLVTSTAELADCKRLAWSSPSKSVGEPWVAAKLAQNAKYLVNCLFAFLLTWYVLGLFMLKRKPDFEDS